MTIKNLPIRYPELGRLRLGEKNTKGGPTKLETWRVTSHDEVITRAVASIYGGEVTPWVDEKAGITDQFQVVTEAREVDVLIPPDPLDLAYERWGSGGRQRRCDGETCLVALRAEAEDGAHFEEHPCWCASQNLTPGEGDDVKKGACDLVVRLKVVLPDVPGLGIFVLTTGSVYAAMELPAQVRLLERMGDGGVLVPASLIIDQRTEKKAWEKYKREYPVPVLRVRRSMTQLAELAGGTPSAPALARESSRPSTIADLPPHVQQVVYACGEHGVSKAEAEALVSHFTGGNETSRKALNLGQAGAMIAVLVDGTWRGLVAAEKPAAEAKPKDGEAKARDARIHDLQTRAQALAPALKDALDAWQRKVKLDRPMPELKDGELTAIDAKLAFYEAQAAEMGADDDDVAEGEVVEGNEQPELAAS